MAAMSSMAALILASVPLSAAENATFSTSNVVLDVQGQSGKFTVYNSDDGANSGIQVIMDALHEVDENGNSVGTSGNVKHSINTFAPQEFTIAAPEVVDLGNVTANKIAFSSPIAGVGQIRVDTFIMAEDGFAGPPGEEWPVRAGDLKWNIELFDWSWCGCSKGQTQEVGAFIDVVVSLKSNMADSVSNNDDTSVALGGGLNMELSKKVQVDGSWQDMPEGYPEVVTQGSMTTMTFRFPRFATSALYDPVVSGFVADSFAHRNLISIAAVMVYLISAISAA